MQRYTILKVVDSINEGIGKGVSWLTTLLVLLVCVDVLLRYLLNVSYAALYELEWHVFALIFLLGSAYALRHDRHVRVDVFYTKMSFKRQAWVDLLGTLLFLIPFCLVLLYAGIKFTYFSYQIGEASGDPGGLPYRFIIKSSIAIAALLLLLQGGVQMAKAVLQIRTNQKFL